MAKKKSAKKTVKKVSGKKVAKKKTAPKKRVASSLKKVNYKPQKAKLALRDLLISVVLFLLSVMIYKISTNELVSNLFWIISLLTGFIAIAFLVVWLIFIFLRVLKK